ncbi:MFS transporter [Acinetobacter gerneri]|uniref:MFS transporter n=1 Tax=Acinetobacter gerneri TaxID=202952 RepID=UPI0023F44C7D|nr:MFS transporter [Acinetobacter gerneri]MCH4243568.1 MFS transporter [Acinetobacter gerneri]
MTNKITLHDIWIILGGYLAAMHVGKLSPIIPILEKELHLSLTQAGLALSLVQGAGMLFALLLGVFSERFGLKKCFLLGLSTLGIASILGVLIQNIYSLFALRFFEGIGFLLVTLTAPAILKRICDPQKINMKMGFWGSYMGLGVGLAMISIPLLLQFMSWQSIWVILGIVCLAVAGIVAKLVQVPHNHNTVSNGHSFSGTLKLILTHPPVVALAIIFTCYTSQWLTVVGFLPSIYTSHHIELKTASLLTAFVSISNILGTLASGWLLHHGITPKRLLRIGFCTMMLMSWVMFFLSDHLAFPIQYLSVVLFSAVGGLIPTTVFAISLHYAPKPYAVAASVGLVLQISAFGQFVLPPLSAMLVSHTHNWSNIAWATTALSILGLFIVWKLFQRHPIQAA